METLSEVAPTVLRMSIPLVIEEESQIGSARRSASVLARQQAMSEDAAGRLAIVVTEAATNILRHAGRGTIILRGLSADPVAGVEMLALDKGPGISDVRRAMQDGYSTIGTAGEGLGAMQRLADVFGVYSQRQGGTVVLARVEEGSRVATRGRRPASFSDRVGAVCVPLRGQTACGDAWYVMSARQRVTMLVVDGLGHGPAADAVAAIALRLAPKLATETPESALAVFDTSMRGTRGAALSVTVIDEKTRTIRFSGVGNVDGRIVSSGPAHHLTPQGGIVGHTMPSVRAYDAPWPEGARLVMHSDGISSKWRMDGYPGLLALHPALLAGVIYRDFCRDRDDATVIVIGEKAHEEVS
jgi:anti-sigma regulatory factor (Ser/Thr protein kinase)